MIDSFLRFFLKKIIDYKTFYGKNGEKKEKKKK